MLIPCFSLLLGMKTGDGRAGTHTETGDKKSLCTWSQVAGGGGCLLSSVPVVGSW